jgi:hypothetical protein
LLLEAKVCHSPGRSWALLSSVTQAKPDKAKRVATITTVGKNGNVTL